MRRTARKKNVRSNNTEWKKTGLWGRRGIITEITIPIMETDTPNVNNGRKDHVQENKTLGNEYGKSSS